MKKAIAILLLFACLMSFPSCGSGSVKIVDRSSEIYSDEDIEAAMEVVMQAFDESSELWYLLELSYIGDEWLDSYQDWADRNDADEVIVILSDFYISYFSDNPTMNTGSKYEDYNWILVRNEGEEWRIVDRGY